MSRINLNKLAQTITANEGGKVSLPIGQVKEVLRLSLAELRREWALGNETGVIDAIKKTPKPRK